MLWAAVDLICVTIFFSFFFVSLFYSDKREFVISCFSDWLFLFAIFCTILLLRFALVDMVQSYHYSIGFFKMCATISVWGKKFVTRKTYRHSEKIMPVLNHLIFLPSLPTWILVPKKYITKFDNFYVSLFAIIRGKVLNQRLWKVENWTN